LSRDGFFFAILFNLLFVYFDEVNNKYAVKKTAYICFLFNKCWCCVYSCQFWAKWTRQAIRLELWS